ncbi:MAG: hypothetical protein MOIL_00650 [Candidatus Methanolliviera sp. GoM_oil]|nr:MAG: hypothetical protein MOIL_00650 [Candidatus Methanolliviera sp. GoM_oil]
MPGRYGNRYQYYATGMPGWMRGAYGNAPYGGPSGYPYGNAPYPERPQEMDLRDELRLLEEDERALGDDLKGIRERIKGIKEEIERRR